MRIVFDDQQRLVAGLNLLAVVRDALFSGRRQRDRRRGDGPRNNTWAGVGERQK